VGELERELDERLRAAEVELASFRDSIATAGPRFEEATESFLGALERLSEEAVAQTRATVDGVTHFLEHAADVHNRLTTELVEASNQAVATIQTVFTETVPGQMPAVYAPLAAEFGDLKTQCDDLKEELGSSVEQMVERLAECEGALQLSDTALERAASLG